MNLLCCPNFSNEDLYVCGGCDLCFFLVVNGGWLMALFSTNANYIRQQLSTLKLNAACRLDNGCNNVQ